MLPKESRRFQAIERNRGHAIGPIAKGALLVSALAVLLSIPFTGLFAYSRVELGYTTTVSTSLIDAYGKRFGWQARRQLEQWKRYAADRKSIASAEIELLTLVNSRLNQLRFVDDATHWGQEDYWATPAESVASGGGDCEDFAITKYFLLKELGVPVSRLRLAYVQAIKLKQPHMVLTYYAVPEAEPLVLDNLDAMVRLASQRPDLVPIYSFNEEDVWMESRGRVASSKQMRNWSELLVRLEREAEIRMQ